MAAAMNIVNPDTGQFSTALSKLEQGLGRAFAKAAAAKNAGCPCPPTGQASTMWRATSSLFAQVSLPKSTM
jgi:hypothetical protein